MVLMPEQIERIGAAASRVDPDDRVVRIMDGYAMNGAPRVMTINWRDAFDTLAAYAEIVQAVAETDAFYILPEGNRFVGLCVFCDALSCMPHDPNCPYLRARKLRGLE